VSHYADDQQGLCTHIGNPELLADGVLPRERTARQNVVNDDDGLAAQAVAIGEEAALPQRNPITLR
jgi:hypothetical protein